MRRPREDFDAFVAGNATRLLRTAYLVTGDQQAAEDVLQDALERVYVAWPRVDDPLAYTRAAIARHAANRWRTRARRPEVTLGRHDTTVPDVADAYARRDLVVNALAQLAPRQRAAVVLRYFDDLSEAETAAALGCSVGTVKSQTSRAIARLRELIPAPGETPALRRAP
jgi:RNA polymerase sigma-70 factor (sigma-E family)